MAGLNKALDASNKTDYPLVSLNKAYETVISGGVYDQGGLGWVVTMIGWLMSRLIYIITGYIGYKS